MHVVVVCPRCKGATAVREEQKSATCPRCGRSYDPRRSRVYHRSRDPAEVARVVGEMNARLEKGFQRYQADVRGAEPRRRVVDGDLESVVSRVSLERGRQRQLEEAVRLLSSREEGTFSSDELFDEQLRLGPNPRVRNPDVSLVDLEYQPLQPDFGQVVQGLFTGQLPDPRAAMQDLDDRSEAELERAIEAARAKGAQVTRDDWVFANWDPTRDYTEADYAASQG